MAIDPKGFNEDDPFSFNRYAYTDDNPYSYKDPNGQIVQYAAGGALGAIWGWGMGYYVLL